MQAKASEGRLRVLDTLAMDSHKTVGISTYIHWHEHTVLGGQHTGQPRPVLKVNHANVAPCYLQRDLDERLNVLLKDSPRRSVLMIDSEKTGNDGG